MRKLSRTVPAPAGLGIDVLGVPAGSDIDLALRLEAVMEGVLVSGTAQAVMSGECVRCLEPVEQDLEVEFQELYAYEPGAADDEDVFLLEGDLLDLEVAVRDALVLALPLQPVCDPDCPGLCPECGTRLADQPDHHHETVDPRWAALQSMLGRTSPHDERES